MAPVKYKLPQKFDSFALLKHIQGRPICFRLKMYYHFLIFHMLLKC